MRNTGTITATLGTVSLASGNMFTLDLYGDKLIQLGVGDEIASQVKRRGDRTAAEIAGHATRASCAPMAAASS